MPIFERPPPKYTATRIMQILLNPSIDLSKVAKERPVRVEESSTFVVDLTCLKHPDDVKKDMYGRGDYSGSHPEVFRCMFDDVDNVSIEKCAVGATGSNVYYLRRVRSTHPSNSDFRRLIAFVHGKEATCSKTFRKKTKHNALSSTTTFKPLILQTWRYTQRSGTSID